MRAPSLAFTKFWCLECDGVFYDEHVCPYCGERNFDVADDDDGEGDGRDYSEPYECQRASSLVGPARLAFSDLACLAVGIAACLCAGPLAIVCWGAIS